MPKALSHDMIKLFRKKISQDSSLRLAQNAAVRNDIIDLAMDWKYFRKIDHTFSDVISGEMRVTDQKSSGRCWGFAGLNLFRIYLGRKHNLKEFEFSQSYFMFWDKLEKANYFLENVIKTINKPSNSRLIMHLLDNPIQDGGQWDMWVNLIKKYGVLPKSEMPESYQSSKSLRMNRMITRKLREFAKVIREAKQNLVSNTDLRAMKTSMLKTVYRMLTIHLGTPPESFSWQIRNKKNEFHRFENLTPIQFFNEHVKLNLDEYICLINCPMPDKAYNEIYTVEYLGNVIEGQSIKYLNVETSVMKKAGVKSIKNNDPVWFGCDVSKYFHRTLGVMDMELFNYELFYGTNFDLDKASRLEYGDSQMTHAMLITGVDLDSKNRPIKWRVENSWGNKNGDKGYHIMSDSWFDEYNYEIVVHKSYLPDDLVKIYETKNPVKLPPWDPMGALAR